MHDTVVYPPDQQSDEQNKRVGRTRRVLVILTVELRILLVITYGYSPDPRRS